MRLLTRRIHYAWLVAGVGLITLVTAAGFRARVGVLIVPLQDEFGWSRARIGFAVAINLVVYGLGGPFAAAFVERYGMRRVITAAVLGIALGAGLSTLMTAPWQLDILWGVVNAAATGAISVPLGAMIANRWFVKRRGLVTGMLTASNATGQLIFLPLLALIVTHWGWRLRVDLRRAHGGCGGRRLVRRRGTHLVRRLRLGLRRVRAPLPVCGRPRRADRAAGADAGARAFLIAAT